MVGKYNYDLKNNLYVLSKENIDFEAERILEKYYPQGLIFPIEIEIDKIIDQMKLNLEYRKLSRNKEILGVCVLKTGRITVIDDDGFEKFEIFKEKTIIINSDLVDENDIRYGSTIGHELGHYVTQGDLYFKNDLQVNELDQPLETYAIICKREDNYFENFFSGHKKLKTKNDWSEWQANYFSSAIVVPKKSLLNYLKPYIEKYDETCDKKILDNLSYDELVVLINGLSELYHVSAQLIVYRLKNLDLLQNNN